MNEITSEEYYERICPLCHESFIVSLSDIMKLMNGIDGVICGLCEEE